MQNKLPKQKQKLPKVKHKQKKTNRYTRTIAQHAKLLNKYNTAEETQLTQNSQ